MPLSYRYVTLHSKLHPALILHIHFGEGGGREVKSILEINLYFN